MNKEKERNLVYLLARKREFTTAKQLARELHSSEKTIYRTIAKINARYHRGSPLIFSERGRGYKLDYQQYIESNQCAGNISIAQNVLPVERRNRILKKLLLVAPRRVRIDNLFKEYFLSFSSQVADEKIMSNILKHYNLKLIKSRGYLNINGPELNIREAIQELIINDTRVDLDQILQDDNYSNKQDANFVFKQIKHIEKNIQGGIPYPYNLNLFSHMYILLNRVRNVKIKHEEKNDEVLNKYLNSISLDKRLFKVSEQVIKDIEKYVCTQLPLIEQYYLYQYLVSSRIDGFTPNILDEKDKAQEITDELIEEVENITGKNFQSLDLKIRLRAHIRPMLKRLDNNIKVNNNLLDQIKIEYTDIFKIVKLASQKLVIKERLPKFGENEIGFLTLYFASTLEKYKQKIPTLIMCMTGIGTSELLKTKVETNFINLDVIDVIATAKLEETLKKYPQIALIISTIKPLKNVGVPLVVVSSMFNIEDRRKLDEEIRRLQ